MNRPDLSTVRPAPPPRCRRLRVLDKWAVLIGGGENHRMGLYDMVLIKDNHIDAAGSLSIAVARARAHLEASGRDLPIEVECRTMDEVAEVRKRTEIFESFSVY